MKRNTYHALLLGFVVWMSTQHVTLGQSTLATQNAPNVALSVPQNSASGCPNGCWMPVLAHPRTCECVQPACTRKLNGDCNLCQRGWGVYATKEACDTSGGPSLPTGIPRAKYPPPKQASLSQSMPNTQQSVSCPTLPMSNGAEQSACPWAESGLVWWQDSTLWNGTAPIDGDVILPPNTKVVMSACSFGNTEPKFNYIRIPASSELIIADEDFALTVGSIIVMNGKLRIGSPTCRLQSKVTITFSRGVNSTVTDADFGIQVSSSGQIDIHGKQYTPTWTNLATTAAAGATSITLKDAVKGQWQVGQQIVIVTTYYKDTASNQNEVRVITGVTGSTVSFAQPLAFSHYGYGGAEYQAEVGLLDRNILLQGSVPNNIGPHIFVNGAVGRFSGVQVYRMGQTNKLGRYSFHYHMVGNTTTTDSFIKDSTCYRSFFRCVTIHGTSGVLVQDTVAFDIQGSAYYMESGVEENNVLDHNLAALVSPLSPVMQGSGQGGGTVSSASGLVDPADAAAAGFYALNLYNTWTNNAASGGFFAYSFPVLSTPLNLFRNWTWFDPGARPFKLFDNNVGHSTGYLWDSGGCLYTGGAAWLVGDEIFYTTARTARNTRAYTGIPEQLGGDATLTITNFKGYLCNIGIVHWGLRAALRNIEIYDSNRLATLLGYSTINNAIVNANTGNPVASRGFPIGNRWDNPPQTGFQWYDTWTTTFLTNVTFVNFKANPSLGYFSPTIFWTITWSDFFKPQAMSYTRNVKFINCDSNILLRLDYYDSGSYYQFNWVDTDGTASGRNTPTVIAPALTGNWWKAGNNNCAQQNYLAYFRNNDTVGNVPFWTCDLLPEQSLARIDIEVPGVTNNIEGTPDSFGNANATRDQIGWVSQLAFRRDIRRLVMTRNTGTVGYVGLKRGTPGAERNSGWQMIFNQGAPTRLNLYLTQIMPNTPLYVALRYPLGTTFSISRQYRWESCSNRRIRQTGDMTEFTSSPDGTRYRVTWINGTVWLFLKMVDPGNAWGSTAPITQDGMVTPRTRWNGLWYNITATVPKCATTFCRMPTVNLLRDWSIMPTALPIPPPSTCTNRPPVQGMWQANCLQVYCSGDCNSATVINNNLCATACNRC